jgi:hypothetical protein
LRAHSFLVFARRPRSRGRSRAHPTTPAAVLPICSNVQPDVTYDDVGGAGEALEKLREVVELPLLHPERFVTLGIDPPKVRPPPPLHTRIRTHACAHTPCSRAEE